MSNIDLYLYVMHTVFWSMFGVTRVVLRLRRREDVPTSTPPKAEAEQEAPNSRLVLGFHMLAFAVMYFGIGNAVIPQRVPFWFDGQRIVGALVVLSGGALAASSLVYFRSWRFRAALDQDHELATAGPFRLIRHPIYMGLNLLALGSAIWVPTPAMWVAAALMIIGSDLRARAEEALLERVFGRAYSEYRGRTRRFVPSIY
jgi:protein-S-isoprenylcysteine O-methyltransferase Ste14